jgi:hypothetical protein
MTHWTNQNYFCSVLQREFVSPVRAVGKFVGKWPEGRWLEPGLDSDRILSPITINWFAGVSIMCDQPPLISFGVCERKAITKTKQNLQRADIMLQL